MRSFTRRPIGPACFVHRIVIHASPRHPRLNISRATGPLPAAVSREARTFPAFAVFQGGPGRSRQRFQGKPGISRLRLSRGPGRSCPCLSRKVRTAPTCAFQGGPGRSCPCLSRKVRTAPTCAFQGGPGRSRQRFQGKPGISRLRLSRGSGPLLPVSFKGSPDRSHLRLSRGSGPFPAAVSREARHLPPAPFKGVRGTLSRRKASPGPFCIPPSRLREGGRGVGGLHTRYTARSPFVWLPAADRIANYILRSTFCILHPEFCPAPNLRRSVASPKIPCYNPSGGICAPTAR